MFNALIKNAIEQNKIVERLWFEYPIGQLISDVGLNSKNREYVKATINSLVGFVVNWDHLSESREWNASGLVAGAKISGSLLRYQFSDNMRELLMNPRIYVNRYADRSGVQARARSYALGKCCTVRRHWTDSKDER